jgi:hypothetical protein
MIFLNFFMDDLYDIHFQSIGEFCKIYIRYNNIDLPKSASILTLT